MSESATSTKRIVDEELALALNRMFGRPAFPVKGEKFGFGVKFAFTGETRHLRLTGGSDESRKQLEVHRARIEKWLRADPPLRLVRVHELLARDGLSVGYTTLRRFVHDELGWSSSRTGATRGSPA